MYLQIYLSAPPPTFCTTSHAICRMSTLSLPDVTSDQISHDFPNVFCKLQALFIKAGGGMGWEQG